MNVIESHSRVGELRWGGEMAFLVSIARDCGCFRLRIFDAQSRFRIGGDAIPPVAFLLRVASHKSLAPLEAPLRARELLQARELISKQHPNEMPSLTHFRAAALLARPTPTNKREQPFPLRTQTLRTLHALRYGPVPKIELLRESELRRQRHSGRPSDVRCAGCGEDLDG